MKIPYYPGCSLKTTGKNLEVSAIAAAKTLGIEMVEIPKWNCCGTVFSLTEDDLMHHVAPVRNLLRVQEMSGNGSVDTPNKMVTLCSMCFNTMKSAAGRVSRNAEDLVKINSFMNLEEDYKGKVQVLHLLEIIRDMGFDKVKEKVSRPLNGLSVAPYYGCMLLRPADIGIDDPEDPTIGKDLFEALGADVVDNPYKKVCCGAFHTVNDKSLVADLGYEILTRAQKAGGEAITTSCPLCAFNLDNRQKEISAAHPEFKQMPVFYFSQLMALAFGLGEEECMFEGNYVDPRPLLKSKNLL
ncbi:heterodisulfide reductase, subunit B [candidate division WOR-3 bacterium]|uniref:Heterodisulfide reductase, subunit B n=1 Tax=candidate division WOR-3 bacterium TaxID=2052148 RepID=A0A9D5KBB1_UNCW3|nr:heterodisulfide reductase, subunit B [candidate division WOR-3 bacterium]MBD3365005.1 heterodisulfide reductase, subunit B [candidate division WOR-3 bacterium]